jgi:hypothetical protein
LDLLFFVRAGSCCGVHQRAVQQAPLHCGECALSLLAQLHRGQAPERVAVDHHLLHLLHHILLIHLNLLLLNLLLLFHFLLLLLLLLLVVLLLLFLRPLLTPPAVGARFALGSPTKIAR